MKLKAKLAKMETQQESDIVASTVSEFLDDAETIEELSLAYAKDGFVCLT
jgi:hypothetical protein